MQEQNLTNKLKTIVMVIRQGEILYGINGARVLEIIPTPQITPMPRQEAYLRGVYNYKGSIIPVLSFGVLCGEEQKSQESVCVILTIENEVLALTVEAVTKLFYDNGILVEWDRESRGSSYLRIIKVIKDKSPIFVLDIPAIVKMLSYK